MNTACMNKMNKAERLLIGAAIADGQDVSADRGGKLRKQLLLYGIKMQTQREHSRYELQQKMLRKAHLLLSKKMNKQGDAYESATDGDYCQEDATVVDQAVVEGVLAELEARQWLSDTRAADSLMNAKKSKWGARKVQHAMQQKGFDADEVQRVQDELAATEYERAQQVWNKKFARRQSNDAGLVEQDEERSRVQPSNAKAKWHAKQVRFLVSRGFSPEVVRRVVKENES